MEGIILFNISDYSIVIVIKTHKQMEQNREFRNGPTEISLPNVFTKVQKQFRGGRLAFLTNGTAIIGYS